MKNLLLITHWYYPRNNPRSFRARALADELIKRGYDVDILIGEQKNLVEESELEDFYSEKSESEGKASDKVKKCVFLKKILTFFIGEKFYFTHLHSMEKCISKKYDGIISVGNPFYSHYLAVKLKRKWKNNACIICDCGDPNYLGFPRHSLLVKAIQKYVFHKASFITVPIPESLEYYISYAQKEKIKVIPQGFSMKNIKLKKYTESNNSIRFAYAGRFYKDIRNPEKLLKLLTTIETDFQFTIYTDFNSAVYRDILIPYKKRLDNKLILKSFLQREECISELSEYDFLINIRNLTHIQAPSKLIDYAIAGRPILDCNPERIPENVLKKFLRKDYSDQLIVDITKYKIENVVKQFIDLLEET